VIHADAAQRIDDRIHHRGRRADVAEPSVRERTTAVAEDVLSTAKSLFHAVLPK